MKEVYHGAIKKTRKPRLKWMRQNTLSDSSKNKMIKKNSNLAICKEGNSDPQRSQSPHPTHNKFNRVAGYKLKIKKLCIEGTSQQSSLIKNSQLISYTVDKSWKPFL